MERLQSEVIKDIRENNYYVYDRLLGTLYKLRVINEQGWNHIYDHLDKSDMVSMFGEDRIYSNEQYR